MDGLEAEREQGITIDVAYRFFATDKRKFIVADTPGHEQYTRNMATGASNSDLAVILIDARKGVLTQTRRHAYIASLLGIRHVVLAVNKIDLVDYSQERVRQDRGGFPRLRGKAGFRQPGGDPDFGALWRQCDRQKRRKRPGTRARRCSPIWKRWMWIPRWPASRSACRCNGSTGPIWISAAFPAPSPAAASSRATRSPWPNRAAPPRSRASSPWTAICAEAVAGDAVTLTLADEVDISRGDVLAAPDARPDVSDQFAAHLLWMAEEEMLPGRQYLLKLGTATVPATISDLKHKIDVNTLDHLAAKTLALNEVGYANFSLAQPLAFDRLSRQSRHRRLHPDRPLHQCHGRRGHDRFRPAARHQCPLAGAGREQSRPAPA